MFKLFKKVQWKTLPASHIRPGDVVSDVFDGEVVYVQTRTDCDLVTLVINMPKEMFGSKIATTTMPPNKRIKVAQR